MVFLAIWSVPLLLFCCMSSEKKASDFEKMPKLYYVESILNIYFPSSLILNYTVSA